MLICEKLLSVIHPEIFIAIIVLLVVLLLFLLERFVVPELSRRRKAKLLRIINTKIEDLEILKEMNCDFMDYLGKDKFSQQDITFHLNNLVTQLEIFILGASPEEKVWCEKALNEIILQYNLIAAPECKISMVELKKDERKLWNIYHSVSRVITKLDRTLKIQKGPVCA